MIKKKERECIMENSIRESLLKIVYEFWGGHWQEVIREISPGVYEHTFHFIEKPEKAIDIKRIKTNELRPLIKWRKRALRG